MGEAVVIRTYESEPEYTADATMLAAGYEIAAQSVGRDFTATGRYAAALALGAVVCGALLFGIVAAVVAFVVGLLVVVLNTTRVYAVTYAMQRPR